MTEPRMFQSALPITASCAPLPEGVELKAGEQVAPGRYELTRASKLWPKSVVPEADIDKIYVQGDPTVLNEPCLSIVGARRGTPYGIALAQMAARIAAEAGITVVSGGAMGVDVAAARAALAAGGKTIVVAGTGADLYYPQTSKDVFEAASSGRGAVVALCPWTAPARRFTFRVRNRLIAALSKVLVVTEAGLPSGTMSTADAALELGRTIYAAPGSIFSPYARGTNYLISQGATIILDEQSLEGAFAYDYGFLRRERVMHEIEHSRLLAALVAQPMRPDDLAASLGIDLLKLLLDLNEHEVKGLIERLPDGRYAPTAHVLQGVVA